MIPFLLCLSWVAVVAFVIIIFVHLVTARWPLTLGLAAAGVVAALVVSLKVFPNPITRSCVPSGAALAWLGAAYWVLRARSVRRDG